MTFARSALAALLLFAVAGCSTSDRADGDPTTAPTSVNTATASPSPTLSPPTIPPEAQDPTAKGAAAFVEYWYEAMRYSAMTGESEILLDASTDECDSCTALAKYDADVHAAGGDYEDLPWVPTVMTSMAERDYFVVLTDATIAAYRYRQRAGDPWAAVKPRTKKHITRLRYGDGGWQIILFTEQLAAQ